MTSVRSVGSRQASLVPYRALSFLLSLAIPFTIARTRTRSARPMALRHHSLN